MRVHIIDDWLDALRQLPCYGRLAGHDVTIWNEHEPDPVRLAARIKDAEILVLVRERTPVTEALVSLLPNLRMISSRGHYPHVDIPALTRRGIVFCSETRKDPLSTATCELAFTLILAGLRDLRNQMDSVRAGRWQTQVGRSAAGRVLGLYGYGAVARQVAAYAKAFGMHVWWWASDAGRERAAADGELVADSRAAFFSQSDVISLHQRVVPATRGSVTAQDLALMKPDSLLVNTARAALIEPGALLAALNAGRPGRAALDVFDVEPVLDASDPLIHHPRVIATPHLGFVTEEVLQIAFDSVFAQIEAYGGGQLLNAINPDAWTAGGR
ncbi:MULTISPECIES: D-2-hydroxyacid dehydrogenase family protein [unclassified Achromobacter]|uniref:D-2-hydroxyacid dehydrogenase family protein n=1 Tax=unclassified Achromobacter TaxID=2626865 RepID=UPI000B516CB5|nr:MULTISPECIES: D-2-hydroxyacid dehydrogenase family protein [unclassified Achromobacter]OWT77345.1 3-phosphoglycerate dehydrogenase [Achromobacter sp. HZ28]OWT78226.1 3-phosphoglycerate dehydrogenase [Achromobacter sp. HZ34]